MLKEVIAAGGAGYLIPAALFALMLYGAKGLFGLHGRRSQHRREFLELWNGERSKDDLWLEVAVRHLFEAYMPASIIRLALAQPNAAKSLLDLSDLWPLLHFDPVTQTVDWRHSRFKSTRRRKIGRALSFVAYFVCMLLAPAAMLIAIKLGPGSATAWVYGFCAVSIGLVAFYCLGRTDVIKAATTVGDAWVARINQAAATAKPLSPPTKTVAQAQIALAASAESVQ